MTCAEARELILAVDALGVGHHLALGELPNRGARELQCLVFHQVNKSIGGIVP